jgi:hypothetical protein
MELRDAIKVLDSDAHARDLDDDIRPYLAEPYRSQKAPFLPREIYDRNLGGTLGQSGAKHEDRLAAMDKQEIHTAVMYPTSGLALVGPANNYNAALCRAYNDFISDYCKARCGSRRSPTFRSTTRGGRQRTQPSRDQAWACGGMGYAQAHIRISAARSSILYEEAQR